MPFSLCHKGFAHWRQLASVALVGWMLTTSLRVHARPGQFLIDVWDNEKGLPSSSVTSIAQTPEGYLWIGTYNGVARFDGVRFVNFSPFNTPELKHGRVRHLFTDVNGTLWINTFDGDMISQRGGVFTAETGWPGGPATMISSCSNQIVFALPNSLVERQGGTEQPGHWQEIPVTGGISGHIACQDFTGTVWYVTIGHRLGRVQGNHSEVLMEPPGLPGRRINWLTTDPAGRLWVGTDGGLARWDGSQFQNQMPDGSQTQEVSFFALNQRGECWVFTNGHMRLCRDRTWVTEAKEWENLPKPYAGAMSSHVDRSGNTWFCNYGMGLLCARSDGTIRTSTKSDGLPGNRIICWLEDHEGNIWVGADRGGLARLHDPQFQSLGTGDDSTVAMSVCQDAQGAIWTGSMGGGLSRWQDGVISNFSLPSIRNKGFVFAACPDQQPGCFWLSADNEDLMRFENGQISRPSWSVHAVKAILRDRHGRTWIGTQYGLDCYADGKLNQLGTNDGFQRNDVRALAEDRQGNVWAGTGNGELYRFGNIGVKAGAFASGVACHAPDRWGNQAIWSLYIDGDTVWAGTFQGGLLRFKDGQFTRYTEEQGLPNSVICQILPDERGNLWLGSYAGIFRVSQADLNALAQGKTNSVAWVTYGRMAGLPSLECSGGYQPSCWRGTDGRLWFSTLKGVVFVQPNGLPENLAPPPVLIEEVIVDGTKINLPATGGAPAIPWQTDLQIGPGKHYVEFHYTGLDFAAPDQVRFRYRLGGLGDQWVEAGTRRFAQYTFLRPGDYHFEVTACNNEGVWSEQAEALALRIQPHFWETWWFFPLLGFCLAGLIAMVARNAYRRKFRRQMERLEQQQAIERERARIAKDIHDDLGAGLTQISLLTELSRRAPSEALGGRLNQISETARELTGAMDEIVWAVNPQNDTLDCLAIYLCKFSQEYLSVAGIRCRLDVPVQLPPHPLTAETRHNVFLAVKETIHNIVKHASATEVCLKLVPAEATFMIMIQDNGRGLNSSGGPTADSARLATGNGLPNLEKRLASIGGRFEIGSVPGQGVTVTLTVPFEPPLSPQLAIPISGGVETSSSPTSRN